MWKWALIAAAVPVGLALIVCVVGALLPRDHVARTEAIVAAPPERVAALIRDVEGQPRWRRNVTGVTILSSGGPVLHYVERSGSDEIIFDFEEVRPGTLFRSTIADPSLPFGGEWTITLLPSGRGVHVAIEERGTVRNVIYRFVSALVFGHTATMTAYLADLEAAATR